MLILHFGHYTSAASSNFLSDFHAIFFHIYSNTGCNTPRWSVGFQFILIEVPGNFMIEKLIAILEVEVDHNFLENFFKKHSLLSEDEK